MKEFVNTAWKDIGYQVYECLCLWTAMETFNARLFKSRLFLTVDKIKLQITKVFMQAGLTHRSISSSNFNQLQFYRDGTLPKH